MATGIKVIAQYYDIETGESLEEEVLGDGEVSRADT